MCSIGEILHNLIMLKETDNMIEELISNSMVACSVLSACGNLPIHNAIENCISDYIVILLIDNFSEGLLINSCDHTFAIHMAIDYAYLTCETIEYMAIHGPSALNYTDINGKLPIHYLCEQPQYIQLFTIFIELCPTSFLESDDDGRLPIHIALSNGTISPHIVERFISLFPQCLRMRDNQGCLPLHYACQWKYYSDVVELMVRLYPASINVRSRNGKLPIHYLCEQPQYVQLFTFFIELCPKSFLESDADGRLPIHIALSNGTISPHIVERFISLFPQCLRMRDNQGCLPLHYACQWNHYSDVVELMVRLYPASINFPSSNGKLPYHYAEQNTGISLNVLLPPLDNLLFC